MSSGHDEGRRDIRRYANEDTSSTTDTELRGWYSYGIAAEVFAVAGVGECHVTSLMLELIVQQDPSYP